MYHLTTAVLAAIAVAQSITDSARFANLPPEVRAALASLADLEKRLQEASFEFEVLDGDTRVKRVRARKDASVRTFWRPDRCYVMGRNPVYAFRLAGKDDKSLAVVFCSTWDRIHDERMRKEFGEIRTILHGASLEGPKSLVDFLNNPEFTVAVAPGWRKSDDVLEIELAYTPINEPKIPDPPPFKAQALLRRLANGQWVLDRLKETILRKGLPPYGSNRFYEWTFDERLGLPVITSSRSELWSDQVPGETQIAHRTIRLLSVGPYPDSDFTLSAFGFPEPFGIEWERPTPWWLYIGGGTLGLLALAAVGYRLFGRRAA